MYYFISYVTNTSLNPYKNKCAQNHYLWGIRQLTLFKQTLKWYCSSKPNTLELEYTVIYCIYSLSENQKSCFHAMSWKSFRLSTQ